MYIPNSELWIKGPDIAVGQGNPYISSYVFGNKIFLAQCATNYGVGVFLI